MFESLVQSALQESQEEEDEGGQACATPAVAAVEHAVVEGKAAPCAMPTTVAALACEPVEEECGP